MPSQIAAVLRYLCLVGNTQGAANRGDAWLLQQFVAQRDEEAFAAILERHGPLVWSVCRRVLREPADAEDAFQATFLVLVRKARSVRRLDALGAWLHRVALNIARTSRAATAKRQVHERQAAIMSEGTSGDEDLGRDWQPLLHEEVDRLPRKYRAPVILCYFQEMTHDAAARQLGWPIGTVKGRLARARNLLRTRLNRRGLTLASAALAAALAEEAATAMPPALLGTALRVATSAVSGGAVSAVVVALAKGALQTMTTTKLVLMMLVLSAVGLLGGLFALGGPAGERQAADDSGPHVTALPAPVTPPRVEVKNAVEKDGVRFEPIIPQREWSIPENKPDARTTVKLALRITNLTNRPFRFTRFDSLFVDMVGPDGKHLQRSGGRRETLPVEGPDCPMVKPGESVTFDIDAHLFWRGGKLRFGGSDGFGGIWGFADELGPGPYQLRICYQNTATEQEVGRAVRTVLKGIWTGDVKAPFVEVVLNAAVALAAPVPPRPKKESDMAESEPVRAEGLELVVLVPKRIPLPGAGSRDVALGLRIRNVSDKPITISVFDVIRPWVFNTVDGVKLGADIGRDGKPKPLPPVTLAPGASWTWQPRAKLDTTTDRATLRLSGPDGLGVPGFWSISTLKMAKHRLSITYDNSNAKQGDVPLWVGKATTKEVEFEIVKDDLTQLQGTWRLVAAEEGGKALPPANFGRNTHWSFEGSTATFESGLRRLTGTITLDDTKAPKWIDLTLGKGPEPVLQGIYELKGDTLRLFLLPPDVGRPTEFKTREGALQTIGTYERVKTDP
jgi:RNA polymerase sigma factor (sigma-70 family)